MPKILVIDDYKIQRELMVNMLNMAGYETVVAKDGAEGVQKAIQIIPDLIICDVQMPNLDGYQVIQTLQQISSTSSIPFLFISARSNTEDIRHGLQLGAEDYLLKPFTYDILISAVEKRLAKIDKIRTNYESNYQILANTPLMGVFVIAEDKIIFNNTKFSEITGVYDKDLSNMYIVTETEKISCPECFKRFEKSLHNEKNLVAQLLKPDSTSFEVEIYLKKTNFKNKNSIIGNILKIDSNTSETQKIAEKINDYYNHKPDELGKIFLRFLDEQVDIGQELMRLTAAFSRNKTVKQSKILENCQLSKREVEILQLICEGLTNTEISEKLFISQRTVDNHRAKILEKTNTKNTAQLVAFSVKNNLISI